jgi:hypothetical protein
MSPLLGNITCSIYEQNYQKYNKNLELQMYHFIIYFWIFLFCYIYFILYEQLTLSSLIMEIVDSYKTIKHLFFESYLTLDDFLDDSIFVKQKTRSRSLSEGDEPLSDTEEFLNELPMKNDWVPIEEDKSWYIGGQQY